MTLQRSRCTPLPSVLEAELKTCYDWSTTGLVWGTSPPMLHMVLAGASPESTNRGDTESEGALPHSSASAKIRVSALGDML